MMIKIYLYHGKWECSDFIKNKKIIYLREIKLCMTRNPIPMDLYENFALGELRVGKSNLIFLSVDLFVV